VRAKKKGEIRVMRPLMEVGGTSTFVTHDVTKVEVRWVETHLKLKSHAPKEHGCLTPRMFVGLSDARGRVGPSLGPGSIFFLFFFLVFSVLHMFCIFFLVFHVLHMYLFETLFSWRFSLFLCSNVWFQNFVQIGSIVEFFFFTSISSN
jgi:hypothetical protein